MNLKVAAIWFCVMLSAVFVLRDGMSVESFRSILLFKIWFAAGYIDADTYEIPDFIHVFLFIAGLIQIQWLPALVGLFVVPLPFFLIAFRAKGKIGGGDVKLMMSSGFALGVVNGVRMMIWGLLLAVLWGMIVQRDREILPLAPFLCAGGYVVLLLY